MGIIHHWDLTLAFGCNTITSLGNKIMTVTLTDTISWAMATKLTELIAQWIFSSFCYLITALDFSFLPPSCGCPPSVIYDVILKCYKYFCSLMFFYSITITIYIYIFGSCLNLFKKQQEKQTSSNIANIAIHFYFLFLELNCWLSNFLLFFILHASKCTSVTLIGMRWWSD